MSAWISSRRASPGQWVEMDFGAPLELAGVTLEQSPEQAGFAQRRKPWWTAASSPCSPARKCWAAIRSSGLEWLLLRDGDYGAEDLRQSAPYWGAVEIAREGDWRVWRLRFKR